MPVDILTGVLHTLVIRRNIRVVHLWTQKAQIQLAIQIAVLQL